MDRANVEKMYPACFDSYEQYAAWRAEAVKERDSAWEADCADTGADPDHIRTATRRVYPIAYQIASVCEDCTKEYQRRMSCERRCANPIEVVAEPTDFTGVFYHGDS